MSNRNPMLPDSPMDGIAEFSGTSDVRPNDQIRVGVNPTEYFYEILTIQKDDILTYDHESEKYEELTKNELRNILMKDSSYKWTILTRELIPIGLASTLCLYVYAAEFPDVPDNRVLIVGWTIEEGQPPRSVSSFDELGKYAKFSEIREDVKNKSGCFEPLFEELSDNIAEIVDLSIISAEFNAQQIFGLKTDPTYDKEMERRLKRDASPINTNDEGDLYD